MTDELLDLVDDKDEIVGEVWKSKANSDPKLIHREALMANKDTARLWHNVEWEKKEYTYTCDGYGDIDEMGGTEEIMKAGNKLYFFYYAGGYIG